MRDTFGWPLSAINQPLCREERKGRIADERRSRLRRGLPQFGEYLEYQGHVGGRRVVFSRLRDASGSESRLASRLSFFSLSRTPVSPTQSSPLRPPDLSNADTVTPLALICPSHAELNLHISIRKHQLRHHSDIHSRAGDSVFCREILPLTSLFFEWYVQICHGRTQSTAYSRSLRYVCPR